MSDAWTSMSGGPERIVVDQPDPNFIARPVGFTARIETTRGDRMWFPPAVRKPPVQPDRGPAASSYGKHLRGKVSVRGGLVVMSVVNTSTGRVVASDNVGLHTIYGRGTGLASMVQDATEATTAARIAWMRGFGRKELR